MQEQFPICIQALVPYRHLWQFLLMVLTMDLSSIMWALFRTYLQTLSAPACCATLSCQWISLITANAIGECWSTRGRPNVVVDRSSIAFVIDPEVVEESVGKILIVNISFPSFSLLIFECWDSFTKYFTSSVTLLLMLNHFLLVHQFDLMLSLLLILD